MVNGGLRRTLAHVVWWVTALDSKNNKEEKTMEVADMRIYRIG